ncbi:MAG: hypothetical protein M5R40_12740 [Anaerolineae bacterium]|nr:hypothetical protein [Anaerolineae bacterium]
MFVLALLLLPALDPDSPQFVANALALSISGVFLLVIVIMGAARRGCRASSSLMTTLRRWTPPRKTTLLRRRLNSPWQGTRVHLWNG